MQQKIYLTEVVLLTKTTNLQDFKDWLEWHLDKCHFEHCHIFDNESPVDIKGVCDKYGSLVTYERIKGFPDQYTLYSRYINRDSKAWWVLPIDDDEFLWMRDFSNVNDMILHYQSKWRDMCKLSIRWKNMFPKDVNTDRGSLSLMAYCSEANEKWAALFDGGNKPVKTFVRTTGPVNYSLATKETHNPIVCNQLSYLCNGERLKGNWYFGEDTDDALKLLHYQFKSKKEWIWKCNHRNRVSMCGGKLYQKCRELVWKRMV